MSAGVEIDVEGRHLSLSNLDKVLYPNGFTKAQVIDYMARIAPVAIPHLTGRALTFRRYPDGTDTPGFFEKRCPGHRPDWVDVALGPGDRKGGIEYCRIDETAAMVWAANMAAIEIHAPMALADDLDTPRALVFDFDPGAPATIVECCQIAVAARDVLDAVGLQGWCKTSGSKGLQMYVPAEHARSDPRRSGRLRARRRSGARTSAARAGHDGDGEGRASRARSSSTGVRTRSTRRRSLRIRCGPGPNRRCRPR